mmetsp:Transcript_16175/g.23476  ORF Transcript_16175/g.23476 Transcript_16175/m.23476 type:complete len:108 (-) Transcript_16175:60-383(-)
MEKRVVVDGAVDFETREVCGSVVVMTDRGRIGEKAKLSGRSAIDRNNISRQAAVVVDLDSICFPEDLIVTNDSNLNANSKFNFNFNQIQSNSINQYFFCGVNNENRG